MKSFILRLSKVISIISPPSAVLACSRLISKATALSHHTDSLAVVDLSIPPFMEVYIEISSNSFKMSIISRMLPSSKILNYFLYLVAFKVSLDFFHTYLFEGNARQIILFSLLNLDFQLRSLKGMMIISSSAAGKYFKFVMNYIINIPRRSKHDEC
jgi:hypothetical protein